MACDRRAACEDAAGESSGVATEDELLAGMKQEAQGGLQEIVDERDRGGHNRAAGDGQEGAQAEEKPAVTWVHLRDISVWDMVDAAGRVFHVPENAALLAVLVVLLLKLSGVSEVIEELLFEPELKMRGGPSPFERDVATEL